MRLFCITSFLAAIGAAAWIAVAPPALADTSTDQPSCHSIGTASECQSPPVQTGPQYPYGYPYALRVYN
jgi:hypothetical protein